MNFSFDLDGTITRHPEVFRALGQSLKAAGHKVYILTGIDLHTFNTKRKAKYPVLSFNDWYDEVITSDQYNVDERAFVPAVLNGKMDNHDLVGIFKRRVCVERNIACHFDDDIDHVRKGRFPLIVGVP